MKPRMRSEEGPRSRDEGSIPFTRPIGKIWFFSAGFKKIIFGFDLP
jgi:hypothetical protein